MNFELIVAFTDEIQSKTVESEVLLLINQACNTKLFRSKSRHSLRIGRNWLARWLVGEAHELLSADQLRGEEAEVSRVEEGNDQHRDEDDEERGDEQVGGPRLAAGRLRRALPGWALASAVRWCGCGCGEDGHGSSLSRH